MRMAEHLRRRLQELRASSPAGLGAGFTLLEMMIVITIMLILLSIGAGRYEMSITRAKEAALKQDLSVMRRAIDQYTIDKEAPPQSLQVRNFSTIHAPGPGELRLPARDSR